MEGLLVPAESLKLKQKILSMYRDEERCLHFPVCKLGVESVRKFAIKREIYVIISIVHDCTLLSFIDILGSLHRLGYKWLEDVESIRGFELGRMGFTVCKCFDYFEKGLSHFYS